MTVEDNNILRFLSFSINLRMCMLRTIMWRSKWARIWILIKKLFRISHFKQASQKNDFREMHGSKELRLFEKLRCVRFSIIRCPHPFLRMSICGAVGPFRGVFCFCSRLALELVLIFIRETFSLIAQNSYPLKES